VKFGADSGAPWWIVRLHLAAAAVASSCRGLRSVAWCYLLSNDCVSLLLFNVVLMESRYHLSLNVIKRTKNAPGDEMMMSSNSVVA
jgi:hypothetical protein